MIRKQITPGRNADCDRRTYLPYSVWNSLKEGPDERCWPQSLWKRVGSVGLKARDVHTALGSSGEVVSHGAWVNNRVPAVHVRWDWTGKYTDVGGRESHPGGVGGYRRPRGEWSVDNRCWLETSVRTHVRLMWRQVVTHRNICNMCVYARLARTYISLLCLLRGHKETRPQQQWTHLSPRSGFLRPFSNKRKEPESLEEKADPRTGNRNILDEPGASCSRKVRRCSKKQNRKHKDRVCQRDTGANWQSSQQPKLEQFEGQNQQSNSVP